MKPRVLLRPSIVDHSRMWFFVCGVAAAGIGLAASLPGGRVSAADPSPPPFAKVQTGSAVEFGESLAASGRCEHRRVFANFFRRE